MHLTMLIAHPYWRLAIVTYLAPLLSYVPVGFDIVHTLLWITLRLGTFDTVPVHSTHWQVWLTWHRSFRTYLLILCVLIENRNLAPSILHSVDIVRVCSMRVDIVPVDIVPVDIVPVCIVRVDWESRLGTFDPSARLLQFDVAVNECCFFSSDECERRT